MPAARCPETGATARNARNQQPDVHSRHKAQPCKFKKAEEISQLPKKLATLPSSRNPVLLLDMSGLLSRNLLIDTTHTQLKACKLKIVTQFNSDRQAARQQFECLYALCTQKDADIDRSHRSLPGTAEEWHKFSQECTLLMLMREAVFKLHFQTVELQQWDEETIQKIEAELRHAMKSLRFTINCQQLQPDKYYNIRIPSHILKWQNEMGYKGRVIAAIHDEAVAEYKSNHPAAETAYQQHLDNCKKLDSEVTVWDASCRDTAELWKSFAKSYIKLAVLRHVLLVHHNHDPFTTTSKQAMIVQRTPAAKRQSTMLQLTSPTNPAMMMPTPSRHKGINNTERRCSRPIYTLAYNKMACLCIDRGKIVWRQLCPIHRKLSDEWRKAAAHEAQKDTYVLCTNVEPDDRFVFHISGIVQGQLCAFEVTGSQLLEDLKHAQKLYTNSLSSVMLELHAIQNVIRQSNPEQLKNLAMIGVSEAARQYEELRISCGRYLMLQNLAYGTPIDIALDAGKRLLISTQVEARLFEFIYDQVGALERWLYDAETHQQGLPCNPVTMPGSRRIQRTVVAVQKEQVVTTLQLFQAAVDYIWPQHKKQTATQQ